MIEKLIVDLAIRLPRGGYSLLKIASKFFTKLKSYPVKLEFSDNVVLDADMANNVCFPLAKYGFYPHQITEDMVIISILKPGDHVVDIGANIGYVSALCATCVENSGTVYSFEPSKVTFNSVAKLSKQLAQIRAFQLAASDYCGKAYFVDEAYSDVSHLGTKGEKRGYEVDVVTLDSWLELNNINRIDFLKIDAEGHDLEVIKGASLLLKRFSPVVEFEVFSAEGLSEISASIKNNIDCDIYRCFNQYPFTMSQSTHATNNYFAIPHAQLSRFPDFLFNRRYLVKEIT